MIHGFDRQLQVVLRALGDVVAPALAGADKHVVEQLHLSMATLGFVAARLPDARRFYRLELSQWLDLAEAVAAAGGDVGDTAGRGRALLESPEADTADYKAATRDCREAIARAAASAEGDRRTAIERLVLDANDGIVGQARQWCAPFGFEIQPETLPAPAW